jgi:cytochrome c oxidase subunit 4
MAETIVGRKVYVFAWAALMVLTVVTAAVSRVDLGAWSGAVALLIASSKAVVVVLFFMHVRYEGQKQIWVVILAGVFWLGLLLVLSMSDYVTRGFVPFPGK